MLSFGAPLSNSRNTVTQELQRADLFTKFHTVYVRVYAGVKCVHLFHSEYRVSYKRFPFIVSVCFFLALLFSFTISSLLMIVTIFLQLLLH